MGKIFKKPTEVWEDQMNDLFLTKKVSNSNRVVEALSIILNMSYGQKNKALVDLYNLKGLDTFVEIVSLFERKTITFPSKDEIKEAVMLALIFYLREVEGHSWAEIKEIVPFEFSSISYSFKLKTLNKFIFRQLLEVFKEGKENIKKEEESSE